MPENRPLFFPERKLVRNCTIILSHSTVGKHLQLSCVYIHNTPHKQTLYNAFKVMANDGYSHLGSNAFSGCKPFTQESCRNNKASHYTNMFTDSNT